MLKIERRSDIDFLNCHYLIKKYIQNHFNLICKNYDCTDDIKNVGAIFYLQDKTDLKRHKEIGLSLSFDKAIYETSDLLVLENGKSKITVFQAVYLLNNDMAITVIFDMKCLDDLTKSWLLEDCTERTVYL